MESERTGAYVLHEMFGWSQEGAQCALTRAERCEGEGFRVGAVQMVVKMYNTLPNKLLTINNEWINSNLTGCAANDSLGEFKHGSHHLVMPGSQKWLFHKLNGICVQSFKKCFRVCARVPVLYFLLVKLPLPMQLNNIYMSSHVIYVVRSLKLI